MVVYIFEVVLNYVICVSFDVFNLLDGDKFSWDCSDKLYKYYCLVY